MEKIFFLIIILVIFKYFNYQNDKFWLLNATPSPEPTKKIIMDDDEQYMDDDEQYMDDDEQYMDDYDPYANKR
jgi:hypothetical protein